MMTKSEKEQGYAAIADFVHNFEKASELSFVYNPVAWALYQTWKKWDLKKKPFEEREPNG